MKKIITTKKELKEFCKETKECEYLAIDTEFIRRKTYKPILCLIQVNNGKRSVAIDPFALDSLSPFYRLINNTPKLVKIIHSARQDLEIFYNDSKKIPSNLVDTQILAMACGYPDSVGYAKLVDKICGKDLHKEYQSSEWDKRPLSSKQVDYAIKDVEYLPKIYFALMEEIKNKGRENWIKDEMAFVLDKNNYKPNYDECWKKIRTKAKTPSYLSVLKALASTREKIAVKHNIPKTFVMSDDKLLKLSLLEDPSVEKMIEKYRINSDYAGLLLKALKKGRKARKHPTIQRRKKCNKALEYMLKLMLNLISDDLKVCSALIAGADDLADLASKYPEQNNKCLSGWRYDVFGKYCQKVKDGKMTIGFDPKTNKLKMYE